ncbi:uncharacterized protein CcaverHIS019_0402260 [Cutaneotrichosporon cavernicola]|uniref:Uncharacterized protein n=1 Tax=Cutaneotrichosporon cavernicola TaxID=279322 RepID=A0AA48L3R3_9TREE|nr:uncharacterized protein CcaverHIS019_0402260 [Cutaneotrichosporon cavernicola]BEI91406.1 hypothetical protein CcaverHIS019_0402260 [Cutaneotrichosporon cavernicola]
MLTGSKSTTGLYAPRIKAIPQRSFPFVKLFKYPSSLPISISSSSKTSTVASPLFIGALYKLVLPRPEIQTTSTSPTFHPHIVS